MTFVIDASIAAAWLLPDEDNDYANRALRTIGAAKAVVPRLFFHEIRNLVVIIERRGRLAKGSAERFMGYARGLPLETRTISADDAIIGFARRFDLSAYDAVWAETVMGNDPSFQDLERRRLVGLRRSPPGPGRHAFFLCGQLAILRIRPVPPRCASGSTLSTGCAPRSAALARLWAAATASSIKASTI